MRLKMNILIVLAALVVASCGGGSGVSGETVVVDVSPAEELRAAGGDQQTIESVQAIYEGFADLDCAGLEAMRLALASDGPRMLVPENQRAWATLVDIAQLRMFDAGCTPSTGSAAAQPSDVVWERVPDDGSELGGPGFQTMWGVTLGGPGLVAVGFAGLPGDFDAAAWTSPDGIAWSMVHSDDVVFGGPGRQSMNSVANSNRGLVAVGWSESADGVVAAVWASPDGATWSRVPHDDAILGGDRDVFMRGVTAGGPGFVAVGWSLAGGSSDGVVWTSPDGVAWSRVPHDEAVFGDAAINQVTVGGPGLVAVGRDTSRGTTVAAVWTSPDGVAWSRVPHDEAVFGGPGDTSLNDVAVGGPGLVAVGRDTSRGTTVAAVWTSPDGVAWSRVPHDEAVFGGLDDEPVLWMSSIASNGQVLVAAGWGGHGNGSDVRVWMSSDGESWARIPDDDAVFGGEHHQEAWDVAIWDALILVVGRDGPSDIDNDAAVWVALPER
jgi:hypothetical protein